MNGRALPVLRGENLSRHYDSGEVRVTALLDANLEIFPGDLIAVLGPSGSGKSTLLNIIGGMDLPSEGHLWYGEKDLSTFSQDALSDYRKDVVGFIFQFFNLIPSLTALENIDLAASIVKNPMKPKEVLDMVGLTDRGHHFPSQLSGGEQQRVSIARAIVKRPALMLCDEPTGALDSQNSKAIIKLLSDLCENLQCPTLIITHDLDIAQVAKRVLTMKDGRIDSQVVNAQPMSPEDLP